MKAVTGGIRMLFLLLMAAIVSCEREFDIELDDNVPQLVVEAYINNEMPQYNYVILSKSKGFYEPGFQNDPVKGAAVSITEGTLLSNNTYQWDETTTTALKEASPAQARNEPVPGLYFDPRLLTADSANALRGRPGKYYRLNIEAEGKKYWAVTFLPSLIPIDSITVGGHYIDIDDEDTFHKARLTIHYKDPDTIGNTQLYFWRYVSAHNNFGWGTIGMNEYTPGTDDLVNGQYIRLTQSYGFLVHDTVHFMMACVERNVYNFWDSFTKARNNDGPFATPVSLKTNINGENVTGCFSGYSISSKTILVE